MNCIFKVATVLCCCACIKITYWPIMIEYFTNISIFLFMCTFFVAVLHQTKSSIRSTSTFFTIPTSYSFIEKLRGEMLYKPILYVIQHTHVHRLQSYISCYSGRLARGLIPLTVLYIPYLYYKKGNFCALI